MEFNDIVTLILFLVFFILPSLLRGLGRKKKKTSAPKKKKRRFSLFGKVGEAVQEFIRELEKQALEAKRQQAEKDGTLWDGVGEEEIEVAEPGASSAPAPVEKQAPQPYHESNASPKKEAPGPPSATAAAGPRADGGCLPQLQGGLPRHPLQQAVVWSEILGKPVALRDD